MGYDADLVEAPRLVFKALTTLSGRSQRFSHLPSNAPGASADWVSRLRSATVIYCKAEALDMALLRLVVPMQNVVAGLHTPLRNPGSASSGLRKLVYSNRSLKALFGESTLHLLHEVQRDEIAGIGRRTFVVWNGIPSPSTLKPDGRPAERGLTATFVGRLTDQKGVERLENFLALQSISRLVVCGDGPLRGYVEELAVRDKRVVFMGWQPNNLVQKTIAENDVLVLPSRWEGMPLTAIESLRIGTPVIAQNLPIMRRLSEDALGIIISDFDSIVDLEMAVSQVRRDMPKASSISDVAAHLFDARTQYAKLLSELISMRTC